MKKIYCLVILMIFVKISFSQGWYFIVCIPTDDYVENQLQYCQYAVISEPYYYKDATSKSIVDDKIIKFVVDHKNYSSFLTKVDDVNKYRKIPWRSEMYVYGPYDSKKKADNDIIVILQCKNPKTAEKDIKEHYKKKYFDYDMIWFSEEINKFLEDYE